MMSESHLTMALDMLSPTSAFAGIFGTSEVNMADGMQKDWRERCVELTNETDSIGLTSLVQDLMEALDRGERSWRHANPRPDAIAANQRAGMSATLLAPAPGNPGYRYICFRTYQIRTETVSHAPVAHRSTIHAP